MEKIYPTAVPVNVSDVRYPTATNTSKKKNKISRIFDYTVYILVMYIQCECDLKTLSRQAMTPRK